MALLEAKGLTVSVTNSNGSFPVISDLSFRLEKGKILGLVGESGAGKSMIGRTIAQLLPPGFSVTGGNLDFGGENLVSMPAQQRRNLLGRDIAFIPQEPLSALNPVLTIGQQMREHLMHIGKTEPSRWRAEALEAFASVHLPGEALLDKYPHQLSGGMCQRVLIAMAFASRPRLLVADEPTTALDVTIQARIVKLIAEMQKRDDTAVIFITHDLRLAAQICDDVLVLYAGRSVEYGSARRLFAEPAHPYSRCLQLANPSMSGERRGLFILPERMPGLQIAKELRGCRFAPRCPNVVPECRTAEPPLVEVQAGHVAACIRPTATKDIAPPAPAMRADASSDDIVLTANGLGKSFVTEWRLFRKPATFTAVKDANFALRQGEFVGIVGESGSGKSTLARLIVGLEKPTQGRLAILGRELAGQGAGDQAFRREHVQIVFQDPQSALNPRRRVEDIVTQVMEAAGSGGAERAERARQLLLDIGLAPEIARRFPSQLSGGQKQRVNIARALCATPRILVADEIVSGLDVSVQAQLLELLARLRGEHGFSMLFISHDLSVVRYLCDRVLVMYKGEIVESGPTAEVFANPRDPYTRALLASVPPDEPDGQWLVEPAEPVAAGASR